MFERELFGFISRLIAFELLKEIVLTKPAESSDLNCRSQSHKFSALQNVVLLTVSVGFSLFIQWIKI